MAVQPKLLKNIVFPNIVLDSNHLQYKEAHKYLGVIICDTLCDDLDIQQQVKATYARGNALISRFRKCDKDVKVKLFKSFCNSFYGCNNWSSYHKYALQKLKSAYGRVFRQLFKVQDKLETSFTMLQLTIDPVVVLVRKMAGSFYRRILCSDNDVIKNVVQSIQFCDSSLFKLWQRILFST